MDERKIEILERAFPRGCIVLHYDNDETFRVLKINPKRDPVFDHWEYAIKNISRAGTNAENCEKEGA